MKARIIRIGKSQGIRIPQALLKQAGLSGEVELSVEGNAVVIKPSAAPPPNNKGASKRAMPALPPYAKLRELARKSPPPASWFEEEEKPF